MKIAVLSPLATVAPHFETELEILQRHLDDGDDVDLVACASGLPGCDFNPAAEPARCRDCLGRRRAGLSLLSGRVGWRALSECSNGPPISQADDFANLDQLQQFTIDQFDIGYAVVSSLISLTRDPHPCLRQHAALVDRLIRAANATYRETLAYIERCHPDRVYVFNGRFAAARAVLRACQAAGVDCWIHERGCDIHHYQLYANSLPHDIERMQQRMHDAWESSPLSTAEKTRLADRWFQDRVDRVERAWHSFVKDQVRGSLPEDWSSDRRNVALFTSSEDEFASIGDCWQPPIYSSQQEGLRSLIAGLKELDPRLKLWVRLHPNLRGQSERFLAPLQDCLADPQVGWILPETPVDSYHLMRQAEKVVTFGSSIGIESVYWGRPSLLLGTSFYRGFRGVYQPASHPQAMQMIESPLEPAADRSDALRYGFWFQTHGIPFQYFEADGLFSGKFKGVVVHAPHVKPPLVQRWMRKAQRWLNRQRAAPRERSPQ